MVKPKIHDKENEGKKPKFYFPAISFIIFYMIIDFTYFRKKLIEPFSAHSSNFNNNSFIMYPVILKGFGFSIIMATFNKQNYLNRSIKSVMFQSFRNFEILCIDDKSTDKSVDIITQFSKIDNRIRPIFFTENKGIFYVRQYGIKVSAYPFIFMLDPDDAFTEGILEHVYTILKKKSYEIVDFKAYQYQYGIISPFPQNYRPSNNLSMKKYHDLFIQDKLYRNLIFRCIKKSLYMTALDYLGEKIITSYIVCSEDYLLFCTCLIFVKSIYFSKFIGYIYSMGLSDSTTNGASARRNCILHARFCDSLIRHIVISNFSSALNLTQHADFSLTGHK